MPSVSNFELFSSKLRKIERNAKENAFFFSFPSARNFELFSSKLRKKIVIMKKNSVLR